MLLNLRFPAVEYRAMGEAAQRKTLLEQPLDNVKARFTLGP